MQDSLLKDIGALCKIKVVALMLLTAIVGMLLASKCCINWLRIVWASCGIACVACAGAICNHLLDRQIDRKMARTANRPIVTGRIPPGVAACGAIAISILGIVILYYLVNPVTMWLTVASLFGYAILYTIWLKQLTPQNIVIGGLAGAMPPLLGWTAVTGSVNAHGLLLPLIIFTWTPAHFWALAIYRVDEYANAKVPMLPMTHGVRFTKLYIILYAVLLLPVTLLPFLIGMAGKVYLWIAMALNILFLRKVVLLYASNSRQVALSTFTFSIKYLLWLFSGLLLDHYI